MKFLDDLAIGGKNSGVSSGGEWGKTVDNGEIEVMSPVDGKIIASVYQASPQDFTRTMEKAAAAFHQWRITPAPKRGEIVRQIGDEFRRHKTSLGTLVSYEMGK